MNEKLAVDSESPTEKSSKKNLNGVHQRRRNCELESPLGIFLITIFVTLISSLIWLVVTLFARLYWYPSLNQMHQFEGTGPLWLIPVADVVYALPLALGVATSFYFLDRLIKPKGLLAILAFLVLMIGCVATLSLIPRIYSYAKLIMALGISIQATRVFVTKQAVSKRWLSVGTAILLVGAIGFAIGGWTLERNAERQKIASLKESKNDRPNILLITLDTVRAESLSLYGNPRQTTPFLDKLAFQSIVFDRALSSSSWTLPTHASIFTGQAPHKLEAGFITPMDDRFPTLAEILVDEGYLTSGFAANFSYCGSRTGINRGFIHYEETRPWPVYYDQRTIVGRLAARSIVKRVTGRTHHHGFDRRSATQITDDTLDWIDRQSESHPMFCFVNYFDAHTPYEPPLDVLIKYKGANPGWADLDPDLVKYEALISYIDTELERLVAELRKRNILDNTILVITSDHGELFGEHNLRLHGNSLYTQVTHMPLIISYPKAIPSGLRIGDFVSLEDIGATIFEQLAIGSSEFSGESLSRYWRNQPDSVQPDVVQPGSVQPDVEKTQDADKPVLDESVPTKPIFSELQKSIRQGGLLNSEGGIVSVVFKQFHLIRYLDSGRQELFDLKSDFAETTDLAEDPLYENQKKELSALLDEYLPADIDKLLNEEDF